MKKKLTYFLYRAKWARVESGNRELGSREEGYVLVATEDGGGMGETR